MAAKNPRINDALDRIEDRYFSELADKLDKPGVKTHSHEDAWK